MVAEQRLIANEHPQYQDDVPHFSGKINEQFVEWVTDVRLWEAQHKNETKSRLGPRLCRRGLLEQPKPIINTLLGQGDLANFTVDKTIETLKKPFLRRRQEALDNCFDTRQGKAEAIQDCINREDIRALPLQNSTKTALDEKMRGYWLIRA